MKNKNDKCPLCEKSCEQKYVRSHFDTKSKTNFDLYQCDNCNVQHWSPMKNPGSKWYENDERYANRNITPTTIPGYQHILSIKKMIKLKRNKSETLLDVGCGHGNFSNFAEKFGFDCTGFDFDRDGIESGKRLFGLKKLYVDYLENYIKTNPDAKYDWVTFFDVFEHVDNHNQFITDIKKVLKTGGGIAMSIPHRDAASWLIPGDLPPRHLSRWDPVTITKFLEKHGFEDVYVGRLQATLDFIVTKLRWKYGKYFNFGLVGKVKQNEAKEKFTNEQGKVSYVQKDNFKVKIVHVLAKSKDYILFGIPAILIYIAMLGAKERYTDMYIIAKKVS